MPCLKSSETLHPGKESLDADPNPGVRFIVKYARLTLACPSVVLSIQMEGPEGSSRKPSKLTLNASVPQEQHAGIKEMATTADVQLRKDSLHLRCRITEETRNELALMKDDKI